MRQDLELKEYAESLGYDAQTTGNGTFWKPGIPNDPYTFVKKPVHIWLTSKGWCNALWTAQRYLDHQYFADLKQALEVVRNET